MNAEDSNEKPKPRVILVHGFASPFSGRYDIDTLRPYFERAGFEVTEFDYGFRFFVSKGNDEWARRLTEQTRPGDIVVGHSNAAVIIQKATWLGAQFGQVVLLAPALDADAEFGSGPRKIHVWWSQYDVATWFAKFIPGHRWGSMGSQGYKGTDPRVINYNRPAYGSSLHLDFLYSKKVRDRFTPRVLEALQVG